MDSDGSVSAPTRRCCRLITPRSKRGQRQECERTHSSPPQTRHRQINVHSDGSANAPTHRCHKLVTPQIQTWTATGVRAHPLIVATDSTPPEKRAQQRECERTHMSLPQTRHPPDPSMDSNGSASAPTHHCHKLNTARETCTATGVRAHPHVTATDLSPPDPSVDSNGSASAPTHRCHRLDTTRETCTAMGVRAHPHIAATDSSPPDPIVDSDGGASAPTHRCHRLNTNREMWTAAGVRAHPHIAATTDNPYT